MVRGPMALFGAIIAVGLGPALWLGAQFGQITVDPSAPSAPTVVDAPQGNAPGRAGAAVDDKNLDDAANIVEGGVGQDLAPVANVTPSPRLTSRSPRVKPSPSRSVRSSRVPQRVLSPTPSSDPPSALPTEDTSSPAGDPSPPTDGDPSTPTDTPTPDRGDPVDVITTPGPPDGTTQNA